MTAALCLGALGCAKKKSGRSYLKDCVLPDNQSGTLQGKWKVQPVPVALQAGAFGSDEIAATEAAAAEWNGFSSASLGLQILDTGGGRTVSSTKPSSICAQTLLSGGGYSGNVVIYKQGAWPSAYSSSAMAITSLCPTAASPYKTFYMAIIELNYQHFFVSGKRIPDLQSVLTHEFGHLIGLKHSCETTGSSGIPSCGSSDSSYLEAMMFPIFGFDVSGYGEIRHDTNENDQGRANCLYQ